MQYIGVLALALLLSVCEGVHGLHDHRVLQNGDSPTHGTSERLSDARQQKCAEVLGSLKSQLTVSANPLAVVGWRCKPESL